MKNLIVLISLLASLALVKADTTTATITATNAVVLDGPYVLQSVTVLQATNGLVRLYDADVKTLVASTNAAYITTRSYTTNVVDNYITSTGITNFFTNTMIWYYPYTNSASTNLADAFSVLAGTTTTPVTETFNRVLQRGLVVSNATSGDIIVRYRTP